LAANTKGSSKSRILLKSLIWFFSILIVLASAVYIAFQVSPWPSALLIRRAFEKDGIKTNEALAKYVPPVITSRLNIQYGSSNYELLDIYYPDEFNNTNKLYPVVVWVHGGAFVAGDKSVISNYCKILSSKGYVVAAVNYSLAPGEHYPTPLKQVNSAIAYLVKNSVELHIDQARIILGGDSGGAHIAAQLANIYTDTTYANALNITPSVNPAYLKGVILFCGPYSADYVSFDGEMKGFLNTVLWSYLGDKDFLNMPNVKYFSVLNYVTSNFPKTFISVGNNDPLRVHSYELSKKLTSLNVQVDSLFFPADHLPALPHEYQFNLDTEAGKQALDETTKFLGETLK
jgi:acetyl esterase